MTYSSSPRKKVIAINDISCFGSASLTTVIPILSTMGIQVCPLPTAILSSQTSGIDDYSFLDLTSELSKIIDHWKRLDLNFDALFSGFLGSKEQVEIVKRCGCELLDNDGLLLVDPVLGDDGNFYMEQMQDLVVEMRSLVSMADIITPNLTEVCFLLDEPYSEKIDNLILKDYLLRLANLEGFKQSASNNTASFQKNKTVIITSTPPDKGEENFIKIVAYEAKNNKFWKVKTPKINAFYPGTGDTYASVFLGSLLQKDSVPMAMGKAAKFVYDCLLHTYGYDLPYTHGIMLEKLLSKLDNIPILDYEIF